MSINLKKPLDPDSEDGRKLLNDLQGNILKAHGRDHAMHLFICFGTPTNEESYEKCLEGARKWIGNIHVTSAAAQRSDDTKQQVFTMLLLSSKGYEFLGERRPKDGAFRDGLRERRNRLNDPQFQQWSPKYKLNEEDIHALVIVAVAKDTKAPDAKTELDKIKDIIEKDLVSFNGSILVDQRGHQKRDTTPEKRTIENFGYADGVSQPQFIIKGNSEAKKYDQLTPLKLILEKDRHGDDGYGSFFVYRLLEQNVASFNAAVERVANELEESPELIGAMAVGRFKNGTPLTTHGDPLPGYKPSKDEDFDYDDDDDGNRCPFHGHIRKANPRGSLGFLRNILAKDQKRRIARRGITYLDEENKTVGLIFMCFQSDICDQFEFIQRRWANSHNFSKIGTGLDPLIGQDGGPQEPNDFPKWPTGYDSKDRKRVRFDEHVKFLGGEYFFAPSISGLKDLGANT
jgi:Dyp-type peroxidase family